MERIVLKLDSTRVNNWLVNNNYQSETIGNLVKELGKFKNREEIDKIYPKFKGTMKNKVCWRDFAEKEKIMILIGKLLNSHDSCAWWWNTYNLSASSIYGIDREEGEDLLYYTPRSVILRWINEKF